MFSLSNGRLRDCAAWEPSAALCFGDLGVRLPFVGAQPCDLAANQNDIPGWLEPLVALHVAADLSVPCFLESAKEGLSASLSVARSGKSLLAFGWHFAVDKSPAKTMMRPIFFVQLVIRSSPKWHEASLEEVVLLPRRSYLRDIVTEFDAPGLYNIQLSVDGTVVDTYQVRLDKDKSTGILWKIARADKAILLLAVVFAAILSYLAIDQLQTFGTVSDYALAFLGGFGLTSTTSRPSASRMTNTFFPFVVFPVR
ncbi:MAG: hypothetical protein WBX22_22855 [Silvibacterium sp.]